jgi:hypothetical protein
MLKGPRSEREGPRSFGAAPIRPLNPLASAHGHWPSRFVLVVVGLRFLMKISNNCRAAWLAVKLA